jgi:hypothetical protein
VFLKRAVTSDAQPAGFRDGFKLHSYQQAAVNWMKTVEADADKRMPVFALSLEELFCLFGFLP